MGIAQGENDSLYCHKLQTPKVGLTCSNLPPVVVLENSFQMKDDICCSADLYSDQLTTWRST